LSRQLDDFYARHILARFRQDRRDRLGVLPLDNTVVVTAISVVERYRLRSGDAIHLATALTVSSLTPSTLLVLVSSDQELIRAARAAGVTTLDPTDGDAIPQLARLRPSTP